MSWDSTLQGPWMSWDSICVGSRHVMGQHLCVVQGCHGIAPVWVQGCHGTAPVWGPGMSWDSIISGVQRCHGTAPVWGPGMSWYSTRVFLWEKGSLCLSHCVPFRERWLSLCLSHCAPFTEKKKECLFTVFPVQKKSCIFLTVLLLEQDGSVFAVLTVFRLDRDISVFAFFAVFY